MFSQACHDEKPAYIKSKGNSRPTSGNSLQVRWESRRRFADVTCRGSREDFVCQCRFTPPPLIKKKNVRELNMRLPQLIRKIFANIRSYLNAFKKILVLFSL